MILFKLFSVQGFCPLNVIIQRAKKVVSDIKGLVDFAIELVNSVIYLPDG